MRKLVLALSISVAALAASTAYFALQLSAARDALATARSPSRSPDPATVIATASQAPSLSTAKLAPPAEESPAPRVVALSISGAERREQSRSFLAKYNDPVSRDELYKERMSMMRPQYADLDRSLGMSREDADRLIELLIHQELAMEEAISKCLLQAGCVYTRVPQDLADTQEREIEERFGSQTLEDLKFYQHSNNERQTVIRVFVEENARIQQDMARVEYGIASSNNGAYVAMDADTTGAREAAATEYNQRLRDRAASVLSSEQLAVYERMLEESVEQNRRIQTFTASPGPTAQPK